MESIKLQQTEIHIHKLLKKIWLQLVPKSYRSIPVFLTILFAFPFLGCKTPTQKYKQPPFFSQWIQEIKIYPFPDSPSFLWRVHIVWKEFPNPMYLKITNSSNGQVVFEGTLQEKKPIYYGNKYPMLPKEFMNTNTHHSMDWEIFLEHNRIQEKKIYTQEYTPEFKRNLQYLLKSL